MTDLLKQIRAEAALPDQAGYEVYSAMGAERENARLTPLIEKLCGVIEAQDSALTKALGKFNAGLDEPEIAVSKCLNGANLVRQAQAEARRLLE